MISTFYKSTRKPAVWRGNRSTTTYYPNGGTHTTYHHTPSVPSLPPPSPPPVLGMNSPTVTPVTMYAKANACGLTLEEYERRDRIVREAERTCPYKVGDTIFSSYPQIHQAHGGFIILGIAKTYEDVKHDTWNNNKAPQILTLRALKSQSKFTSTTEDFQRLNPHPQ